MFSTSSMSTNTRRGCGAPYVFNIVNDLKAAARKRGEDIIDFGMGNPDMPTPKHIVDKLIAAASDPRNHRYSVSRGIHRLRGAMADWYKRRYDVDLDPENEVVATIGSKEGISHLSLAVTAPGDVVMVPDPCYPIHFYSAVIANADVRSVPLVEDEDDFLERVERAPGVAKVIMNDGLARRIPRCPNRRRRAGRSGWT